MLSKETLDIINSQKNILIQESKEISIVIQNGFAHGSVTVTSKDENIIKELSSELSWESKKTYDAYSIQRGFNGGFAIAAGNAIKSDLEIEGWKVSLDIKACR